MQQTTPPPAPLEPVALAPFHVERLEMYEQVAQGKHAALKPSRTEGFGQ